MGKKLATLAVVLTLALTICAFRETRDPERTLDPLAAALVADMNRERAANGLNPLRIDDELAQAASDRIADMFTKHYFDHVSPDGIEPWTWADRCGYRYHEFGENLAVGYPSAASIVDGWMHSPHHRANILGKDYIDVGVAIAAGSPTKPFRGPTVVALYGERM
ncbi:MAG TPA: CAP domain-containing protein [Thermoanaerobaculia bacterium]|jgi:uncharacterized protein YkwD|nr:CAP domain-containing protein [Thermoanaerobaculia bacterium]